MSKNNIGFLDLFKSRFRRSFIVGSIMISMQSICGYNVMLVYSDQFFDTGLDDSRSVALTFTIWFGVINLIGTLASVKTLHKFSRKTLLVTGTLFSGLFEVMFAVNVIDNPRPTTMGKLWLILWPIPFCLSLGSVVYAILPESLPEKGVNFALSCNWVVAFLTVQFFPYVLANDVFTATVLITGLSYHCQCCILTIHSC